MSARMLYQTRGSSSSDRIVRRGMFSRGVHGGLGPLRGFCGARLVISEVIAAFRGGKADSLEYSEKEPSGIGNGWILVGEGLAESN
jgi:hypothetical protein